MFILEDDIWGIRKTVKEIFLKYRREYNYWESLSDWEFDGIYNQLIPRAYLQSKSTVLRHLEKIKEIIVRYYDSFPTIWIRRVNGGRIIFKCVPLTQDILELYYGDNQISFPSYEEIEKEKQKWYQNPDYKQSKSQIILDELIQLKITKRKG